MSSFSSITPPSFKHDVFLSFRCEEDTHNGFNSRLHHALHLKGIKVFIYDKLYRGDEITSAVLKAIEESRILVVIFSKHDASSRWCFEELVHIHQCKKFYDQIVIPVFYDIFPSAVRKHTGSFADAFKKHEYLYDDEFLQKRRDALTEISNLSGFHSGVMKPESRLIEDIVEDILMKLNNMSRSHSIDIKEQDRGDEDNMSSRHSIDIKGQDKGDEDNNVIHKITAERIFVTINFVLEVPSAIFDKLSSVHKPQYALLSMLMSLTTMLVCIFDLVYKGGEGKVNWRWREKAPWFYYPNRRPFGTVTDFIGLLCAVFQCILTTADYAFYLQNINDPIKLSVWPLIFAFCLLCSNLSKNPHKKAI